MKKLIVLTLLAFALAAGGVAVTTLGFTQAIANLAAPATPAAS